jgi:serine/threonine protein kinase
MFHNGDNDNDKEPALPKLVKYHPCGYRADTNQKQRTLEIIQHLDEGGFGQVVLAKDECGEPFAIKIGRVSKLEKLFLRSCNEYYGKGVIKAGEKQLTFHVIKLRGNTNLMQMIRQSIQNGNKITSAQTVEIIQGCVRELLDLHKKGYSHNDVQAKNITMNDEGEIFIVDYGTLSKLESDHKDFKYLKNNVCPLLAAISDVIDQKDLLRLLDDMVDSRCGCIEKDVVQKLLAQHQSNIASLSPSRMLNVFQLFSERPDVRLLHEMEKAPNDYRRFIIANKFVQENPDHNLSRLLSAAAKRSYSLPTLK